MFQPHKKGTAIFLDAHLPPPPCLVKKWVKDDKKTAKKRNKNQLTKQKITVKPITAKEAKSHLKYLNEKEIPLLRSELDTVNHQLEKERKIFNGTIGELVSTLSTKQKVGELKDEQMQSLQMKEAEYVKEIEEKNLQIESLNNELKAYRQTNSQNVIEGGMHVHSDL